MSNSNTVFTGVNVSTFTSICESALTTFADRAAAAHNLSLFLDENRVRSMRGLNAGQIEIILNDWYNALYKKVKTKTGANNPVVLTGNEKGNFSASDFIVFDENEMEILQIEGKFGSMTNKAIGHDHATGVLNYTAFNFTPEEREKMLNLIYYGKAKEALEMSKNIMSLYASEFNSNHTEISSQKLHDMLTISGAEGNKASNYMMVAFKVNKNLRGTIQEKLLSISADESWDVQAKVTQTKRSSRITYHFKSKDTDNTVRMLFNNKNSTHVYLDNGEIKKLSKKDESRGGYRKIDSFYQVGQGSFNVWFKSRKAV